MIKELKKVEYEIHNKGTRKEKKLEQVAIKEEHEFQFSWDRYSGVLWHAQAARNQLTSGNMKQPGQNPCAVQFRSVSSIFPSMGEVL
ncbi:hypothetical protein [Paenibacillus sp. FSL L8-0689]|uniref:hypothetical protein n=1 Tax=unclassified Paenibacillus TaxID=185978 RepID=UPI0030F8AA0D